MIHSCLGIFQAKFYLLTRGKTYLFSQRVALAKELHMPLLGLVQADFGMQAILQLAKIRPSVSINSSFLLPMLLIACSTANNFGL